MKKGPGLPGPFISFAEEAPPHRRQKFLGHSDPGFTPRIYVHLLPEDLPEPVTSPAAAPLKPEENELLALAEVTTG